MDRFTYTLLTGDEQYDLKEEIIAPFAIGYGLQHRRLEKNARRKLRRRYLTRADLLPDPRVNTPFQAVRNARNDRAYITTMGVDVATFEYLLSEFVKKWSTSTIPREDVHRLGMPRRGRRSLEADGALGLALYYLSSCMQEAHLQEIFALTPTTCSRYLNFALNILLQVLRRLPESRIVWWNGEEFEEDEELILNRHRRLAGAIGSVDGLSLPCAVSSDPETENACYNGWKSGHRISNIFVFSPKGMHVICF
jgi:hypothetical protein